MRDYPVRGLLILNGTSQCVKVLAFQYSDRTGNGPTLFEHVGIRGKSDEERARAGFKVRSAQAQRFNHQGRWLQEELKATIRQ